MIWNVPKIWQNGEVWILGGGPSVFKQFEVPKEVTQKVLAGASPSLYSPYLSFLHDKHVIGINIAYRIGDWIDVIFFGDAGFFTQYKLELANFNGLKVSCSDSIANQDWIKHTPHHPKYYYGISQTIGYVCWNGNSGGAAISVAAQMGAKKIYLLGFDMKLDEKENQHWHNIYRFNPNKKETQMPFDKHLMGFPKIAEDAKRLGIKIINVNPESAIDVFPKVSLREILKVNEVLI